MTTQPFIPGDVVRYVEVHEDGDAEARFTVLEVTGDRVRVRFIAPELAYPPVYVQPVSWFVKSDSK